MTTTPRHFLSVRDLAPNEFRLLISRASELKQMHQHKELYMPLKGRVLGMIFEKSSTRTRVSFEAGMAQFGGHAINLTPRDSQIGRGEPIEDTAKVLSQMVDAIMIRTHSHAIVETFANAASIPIINGLTDLLHPCQMLADMQTWWEHRGDMRGKTATWVGDGNNVCNSWIATAIQLGFHLRIACPKGYEPDENLLKLAGDQVTLLHDAKAACEGSHAIITDVWASMGQEEEQARRKIDFEAYQVTQNLMSLADKEAIFMHCLPAHRGEEVSADVIDGQQSVVWDEAGNRLHAQKALLELLLVDKNNI